MQNEYNGNFSAERLKKTFADFEDLKERFRGLSWDGAGYQQTINIIELIKSEDSNLAEAWQNTQDTAINVSQKAQSLISKLQDELQKYVIKTLENEGTTEQAVNSINTALERQNAELEKINF